jgi:hypothetical protein
MKRTLFIFLLLACAPLHGDERFLIERIDVRHLIRASPDVIRSESRLREGQAYTEGELRTASDRVSRLPFLLDASFSLERGSVRDAYVLVITVNETKPLFYLLNLIPFQKDNNVLVAVDREALLGVRWFAGKRGVFHLAAIGHEDARPFESSYLALQGGYTQYGLFHDRAFATLTVSRYVSSASGTARTTLPGGLIGISLTPRQTLTISYTAIADFNTSKRILESRLAYNTTNHPYFPSAGTLISIAPVVAWVDGSRVRAVGSPSTAFHDIDTAIDGHAAHYWTLGGRFTAAAILDGGAVHIDRREEDSVTLTNVHYGTATLQLLRAIGEKNGENEQRIELMLRGVSRHHEFVPLLKDNSTQASLSWVRRNSWGFLRLGVGYAW